ncbi:MAG: ribonuclease H-like domain-containing protein [Calditrichaeota bacterium]|nr:ribonuclease H-like domain-containing protein [Calditrichota bacterium]
MDLSKKLAYYKQQAGISEEPVKLSPSLTALKERFNAEILFEDAPVLKIKKEHSFPEYNNLQVILKLLTKNEFSKPIDRSRCVFFDLETTGLAGGAGTFAFLIGFAWWDKDRVVTKQYFLPDYGREYFLFSKLQEWISSFDYIISFNGKSYDMPLLSNRFILNRIQPLFKQSAHIDLLHLCRRIWKNTLDSCDLGSIETHLLGIERSDDIPGAFIPQAYFDFINTGVIHDVVRMIEHNLQDIISLALIFDKLAHLEQEPHKLKLETNDFARLAKLAFESSNFSYYSFLENEQSIKYSAEYYYWKSMALKKEKRWEDANLLWEKLFSNGDFCLIAMEESAKYYEHVKKDYTKAMDVVDAAQKRFDLQDELGYRVFDPQWQERFLKRKQRLTERKLMA